jgi:hypothetical protein
MIVSALINPKESTANEEKGYSKETCGKGRQTHRPEEGQGDLQRQSPREIGDPALGQLQVRPAWRTLVEEADLTRGIRYDYCFFFSFERLASMKARSSLAASSNLSHCS